MNTFYNNNPFISKFIQVLSKIFSNQTKPTKKHIIEFIFSIFSLNQYNSVKFNYDHFIKNISSSSLNSFYYMLNNSKISLKDWTSKLLEVTLPLHDSKQPIVISIDDTLVEKAGTHFEYESKLHDHTLSNGTCYLNGHCFVCLQLHLSIKSNNKRQNLSFPIAIEVWKKEYSKLELGANMIKKVMKSIPKTQNVILCCDSWYPKGEIIDLINYYPNLDIICNARHDTVLYDLPPIPTGKKGRPRTHGERISPDDFLYKYINGYEYLVGTREVKTTLFGNRTVYAIATKSKNKGSKRLFLCTKNPEELGFDVQYLSDNQITLYNNAGKEFLPLAIYSLRWEIEVSFYELKSFWSFSDYKVRSKNGIERLLNLLAISYATTILLPYLFEEFSYLKGESAQEIRFIIGRYIYVMAFLSTLDPIAKTHKNTSNLFSYLNSASFANNFFS